MSRSYTSSLPALLQKEKRKSCQAICSETCEATNSAHCSNADRHSCVPVVLYWERCYGLTSQNLVQYNSVMTTAPIISSIKVY
jgi:hypothetical protein